MRDLEEKCYSIWLKATREVAWCSICLNEVTVFILGGFMVSSLTIQFEPLYLFFLYGKKLNGQESQIAYYLNFVI